MEGVDLEFLKKLLLSIIRTTSLRLNLFCALIFFCEKSLSGHIVIGHQNYLLVAVQKSSRSFCVSLRYCATVSSCCRVMSVTVCSSLPIWSLYTSHLYRSWASTLNLYISSSDCASCSVSHSMSSLSVAFSVSVHVQSSSVSVWSVKGLRNILGVITGSTLGSPVLSCSRACFPCPCAPPPRSALLLHRLHL